jgi:hypothetical protein
MSNFDAVVSSNQNPASTSRFQARQSTIDMLRLRHGRHRVSAGGMASRGAAGILSTCHDLRGGESAAGRAKSDPKPEPSLVSMGNLRVGNRVARAWPERLLVSLVGIAPRADDPARVTTPRAFAAAVAAIGGKIDRHLRAKCVTIVLVKDPSTPLGTTIFVDFGLCNDRFSFDIGRVTFS